MKNTTIFKRLLGYLKAYRLRLFFVLLSAVISTAFMVLAPFLVGKVTTTLFASIADKVFYWETIIWLLAALVALYFVSQLFSFLQGFGMAKITANGHQIIGQKIPLFDTLDGATIENVKLVQGEINQKGTDKVAALAKTSQADTLIKDVYVRDMSVTGQSNVAGG